MNIAEISPKQLRKAAKIKETIVRLQKDVARILGGNVATGPSPEKAKRRLSAAVKARMSKAAKARWARVKAAKG